MAQQLDQETSPLPKLKFAIVGNLTKDANNQNTLDGYRLIVTNYGKAPAILSIPFDKSDTPHSKCRFIPFYHTDYVLAHGHFSEALQNSIVVPPNTVQQLFTGTRRLGPYIRDNIDVCTYYFAFSESVSRSEYTVTLTYNRKENLTVSEAQVYYAET